MTVIIDLYTLFSKYGIVGIESIQHLILFIVLFNLNIVVPETTSLNVLNLYNSDIESFKSIILSIKDELNTKLNIFNFNINNIIFDIHDKIITIFKKNNNSIDFDSFFDELFKFYLNNENLSISKDYSKFYYNKFLSKWLYNFAKPKIDKNYEVILEGNLKINSIISNINNTDKNYYIENVFGVQTKNMVSDINILQLYRKSKSMISKNITFDDVLINDFKSCKKTFDVIFYDFPQGVHNIIHANCCKKIKNFKIRGTKAEPLLLQLIIGSLNKNGRAYLIVPDSLLFSDSIQHVETRKYLLENLCVNKIIQIDEQFYFNKSIKNSILFFENINKTTKVDFSKISLCGENVKETNLNSFDIDKIKNNLYSLYYKNYQTELSKSIEFKCVNDLFNFTNNKINISNYIGLSKYYKNETSIKYVDNMDNEIFETIIYMDEKANSNIKSNIFMLKYLENNLKNKFEQFTKGKMNQFDIDKIKSFKIPILSDETQIAVFNYLDLINEMTKCNLNKINMIKQMIDCIMKTIPTNNMIELSSICDLYDDSKDSNLIGIIKNGLTAGSVYKINDISKISNNSYYLVIKNNKYLFDFIYHWLVYNEIKLKELSNLTPQSNLNKSNLLLFKIPAINLDKQLDIISYCNEFESQITRYKLDNKALSEKDILSTVLKLNN